MAPLKDLAFARRALAAVLPKLIGFAHRHLPDSIFVPYFERGIAALDSPSPLAAKETSDFEACPVMPLEAKQLVGSAGAAWVFGGMGWWNDSGFSDRNVDAEFRALNTEFWTALVNAVVTAANSTSAE